MASDEGVEDMSSVVECLVNMFGGVINRDAIFTVVESCGGDCKYQYNYKVFIAFLFISLIHFWRQQSVLVHTLVMITLCYCC